jgi:LysM repeat protein
MNMNTVRFLNRYCGISILILSLLPLLSFKANAFNSPVFAEYIKRVENLNTVIDIRINDDVTKLIDQYVSRHRNHSEILLGRTSLYFPMIENVIREKNLPDELKYIAVIESNLRPDVVSRQGAAGLWQFMKGTALIFGMSVDKHIDERRDIYKSTEKALDYLKILYNTYGDWTLALAAYNCGSGRVNSAISKSGGKADYWAIRKFLPKETQLYIPKFIAASYLMNYYYLHDLNPVTIAPELKHTATLRVFNNISFEQISAEFGVDIETLKFLNPMFVGGKIPASREGSYYLTLPESVMFSYVDKYSSPEHLVFLPANFVKVGFNKSNIAFNKDNASGYIAVLQNRNHSIQDNSGSVRFINQLKSELNLASADLRYYKLGRKESLSDVARSNNMTLEELMKINNLAETTALPPGSVIRI